jgi:hypothetical protein
MVLFSLGYLFKHTEPGHQVIIKDFTCLGKYANGPKDIEKCMSHDEREKYVMTMVKKHFPERQKDVVIIDVEQEA